MIKNIFKKYSTELKPIKTNLQTQGKKLTDIKGVLFDIYGTLFISSSGDISLQNLNQSVHNKLPNLLKQFSIEIEPQELIDQLTNAIKESHKQSKGRSVKYPEVDIREIWQSIVNLKSDQLEEFATSYEAIVNPVWPMPGLSSLLKTLSHKKFALGIISNAQFFTPYLFESFLDKNLAELGFDSNLCFFSFSHKIAKPSEKLYEAAVSALSKYKLSPSNIVYVGNDMLNDILPSKNLGFKTCLFAGDKRSLRMRSEDFRCQNCEPDIIITELEQILNYI